MKSQWRQGVAVDHDGIISLNLPTAVQSPRSKGNGQYDAGNDDDDPAGGVPGEYVFDTVTYDNASAHDLTDDAIVEDVLTEIPGVLAVTGFLHQPETQKQQLRILSAIISSVRT